MTNLTVQSTTPAAAAVAASTTAATNATPATSGSGSTITQSDFLQLLTAQLQYQSPASPASPTALASEFAQISTVTGINQVNTTLSAMQTGQAASQLSQSAALVGKQITVNGSELVPGTSGSATGAFALGSAAHSVSVTILSPNGTVAGTEKLGSLSAGQQSFSWSGGTPGKSYTYQVSASSATGAAVSVTPYTVYTVTGVSASGGSQSFNVQGSATPIPASSVQSVLGATS